MRPGDKVLLLKSDIILIANLKKIHSVKEWAELVECKSTQWFARNYFKCFHERPKKVINRIRLLRIYELIYSDIEISGYELVWQVGLKDEKDLYDFLKYHTDMNFTELKFFIESIVKKDTQISE
ncbi:MAG TPA: hypothetical protein VKA34_00110 [Balneolales bacterium]|nr:hypothetical protein [Balneolales bacterium]